MEQRLGWNYSQNSFVPKSSKQKGPVSKKTKRSRNTSSKGKRSSRKTEPTRKKTMKSSAENIDGERGDDINQYAQGQGQSLEQEGSANINLENDNDDFSSTGALADGVLGGDINGVAEDPDSMLD